MAIIGISGYAGAGKDTVGLVIQHLLIKNKEHYFSDIFKYPKKYENYLREKSGWEIKKWAGKLKQIASILTGIPVEKFEDQEFKKTQLGPEWGNMTVREFLQKLGTEGLRDGLHTNTWVNALMADYKNTITGIDDEGNDTYPNWIITDTRFPNEAKAIKDAGGIIIRVESKMWGAKERMKHPSETALDDWKFDYVIENLGDMEMLFWVVIDVLKAEGLAKYFTKT